MTVHTRPKSAWIVAATTLLTVALAGPEIHPATPSQQRSGRSANQALRLYVLDCGTLMGNNPASFGITSAAPNGWMSAMAALVVHPGGTLLWDAGGVPDSLVKLGVVSDVAITVPGRKAPAQWRIEKTLKGQLSEIGYTPSQIGYLALSHFHHDHTANANDYVRSTWLVQRGDRDAMFGDKPPLIAIPETYNLLRDSKTTVLDGDHDVFGDGTVVLKASPGHTPGHQSLFIKLAHSGPILLSGDLYHYPEERTQGRSTSDLEKQSREAIEAFVRKSGAQLWIQHDIVGFGKLKKAPAYYE